MNERILVVDDDASLRSFLATVLREEGYIVREARDAEDCLKKLEEMDAHLVFSDLRMPGMDGLGLLTQVRKFWPSTQVVLMTAYGEVETAVQAMKRGAADYLTKPFNSPGEIRMLASRVLQRTRVEEDLALLKDEVNAGIPPLDTIFMGQEMQKCLELLRSVAPTPASVLITGESGTGKELVARVLHQLSPRRERAMVAVHCAALSESLLESELFGHEKGAFTGAIHARKGRFELADGGTLFLDEIGEISQSLQVKLLRVLQERTFERVGGTSSIQVDTRVVAATNRDLNKEVAEGRFRNDLFFRLNVFPIRLPPLRERKETILPLTDYFLEKYRAAFGKPRIEVTRDAESALLAYPWPGNIRELENIIERSVIIARGQITGDMIPTRAGGFPTSPEAEPVHLQEEGRLKQKEKEVILHALRESGNNRTQAARLLGISRRTLQYRLKEYGITGPEKGE